MYMYCPMVNTTVEPVITGNNLIPISVITLRHHNYVVKSANLMTYVYVAYTNPVVWVYLCHSKTHPLFMKCGVMAQVQSVRHTCIQPCFLCIFSNPYMSPLNSKTCLHSFLLLILYTIELHSTKLRCIVYVRDSVALRIYVALLSQALFSDMAPRG